MDHAGVDVSQTLDTDSSKTIADESESYNDEFVVFPLAGEKMVMVGRMPTNEVVVDVDTVSQVHAVIRRDDKGEFNLHDAGSRNGTFVNGTQVPKQGTGNPVTLRTGCRISLGNCNFTFLDGTTFHRFVNALYRF